VLFALASVPLPPPPTTHKPHFWPTLVWTDPLEGWTGQMGWGKEGAGARAEREGSEKGAGS